MLATLMMPAAIATLIRRLRHASAAMITLIHAID